ncbi:hypothetical protein LguiB_016363 [Lonicera macranthoides]
MAWKGKDDVGGLVRMREIQGKGRGVVAAQPLKAGQIVLTDSPILLYSAFPFAAAAGGANNYCSNCFRFISIQQSTTTTTSVIVGCPGCSCDFFFCSPKCQSIGMSSSSHTPWVCQSLCRLRPLLQHHPLDLQLQARFLIAAYNLSPSHFQTLLSLQGSSSVDDPNNNNSLFLHSLISSLSPPPPQLSAPIEFCPQLTAALLAKDKLNAFGLMEPFSEEKSGYRSVRAYGIYPRASFFNHDCLPNACRFDYLDHQSSTSTTTTDLIIRMIHDVPQGREICLSYFPVNLNYSDRQRRLRDDYGFACNCDRCEVEANWSDHEPMDDDDEEDCDQDMLGEMESETESSGRGGLVKEDNNNDDDFPHAYFFLRYMCNRNNCWGTLAPLPPTPTPDHHSPTPTPSTVLECNVCGNFHVAPEE